MVLETGDAKMRMRVSEEEDRAEVHMAPLIDCVFLLLIFFLVAGTLKKAHKEVEIELPHSAAAHKAKSEYSTLVIEVAHNGAIYLDTEPMTKTLLRNRLRDAAAEAPDRRVRIDADRRTAFQHITYVMDLLQFEGLRNISFRTRD
jgi:biopolymer transport protein ExbD